MCCVTSWKNRLYRLKSEFELGQNRLVELEAQAASLHNILLRISGAVQVLEEELGKGRLLPQHEQTRRVPAANGTSS